MSDSNAARAPGRATLACRAMTMVLGAALAACSSGVAPEKAPEKTGQSAEAVTAVTVASSVLYAQRSVKLGDHVGVNGGDIGVASLAPSTFGSQTVVGASTQVDSNHSIVSPSTTLAAGAIVGTVDTNALTNNGGTLKAKAPYPGSPGPLPLARPSSNAGSNVTVNAGGKVTLTPGTYGKLSVASSASLKLSPGTFYFSSVSIGQGATVTGDAAGVTVQVAGGMTVGASSTIAPPSGTTAGQLLIFVSGQDSTSPAAATVTLGSRVQMTALLAVPQGTLSLADHVQVLGALSAFDLALGSYDQITFQSGFSAAAASPHGQQSIPGEVIPNVAAGKFPVVGPVPGNMPMSLVIGLPVQHQDLLDQLLKDLYDPSSSRYHHYLSPTDFGGQFGASQSDYQAVTGFATSRGLQQLTYPGQYAVTVSGPASAIESAFYVSLNLYLRPDGSQFYAVTSDPSADLSATIQHVTGLNSYAVSRRADGTASTGCTQGVREYVGYDFRHAYLPCLSDPITTPSGADQGANQTVAIYAQDGIPTEDIDAYASHYLHITPNPIPVPVSPATAAFQPDTSGTWIEVLTDIDMVMSMAPKATIRVYEDNPFGTSSTYSEHPTNALVQMASDDTAQVISNSYIFGEVDPIQVIAFEEFAAQGQSFFQAAGDDGAWGPGNPSGNNVPPPMRTSPLMTVVGGTALTSGTVCTNGDLSACTLPASYPTPYYGSETVWLDLGTSPPKDATGGGLVTAFVASDTGESFAALPIPTWQKLVAPTPWVTPANPDLSSSVRMLPDVSIVATHFTTWQSNTTGCSGSGVSESCSLISGSAHEVACGNGTSYSAPLWAGIAAIINELSPNGRIGFANPALYNLARDKTKYGGNFNDITSGNNDLACAPNCTSPISYSAYTGYDLATGLGSPQCSLVTALTATATCTAGGPYVDLDTDANNCGVCGNACATGTPTCCAASCVDMTTDPLNCGGCAKACTSTDPNVATISCSASQCVFQCKDGYAYCNGTCIPDQSSTDNCGGCGHVCPTAANANTSCNAGVCALNCFGGYTLCGNSTCVNESADLNNCGGCGTRCPGVQNGNGTATCSGGHCGIACNSGLSFCNGNCLDESSDTHNCGSCTNVCPLAIGDGTTTCSGGQCGITCNGTLSLCGRTCLDESSDVTNCGACGNQCPNVMSGNGARTCTSGHCGIACASGLTLCGGGTTCVDVTSDVTNCGTCNDVCPSEPNGNGFQTCVSGSCGITCFGGRTLCGNTCFDEANDVAHCGGCTNQCPGEPNSNGTATCSNGQCGITCNQGLTLCGGGTTCVNVTDDPNNCNSCDEVCPNEPFGNGTATCQFGTCGITCNGTLSLCGNLCVDESSSVDHCNACDNVCPSEPNGHGTRTCTAGLCGITCDPGLSLCANNTCVDESSDVNNCGTCGNVCGSGQSCCGGQCVDLTANSDNCGVCGKGCGTGGSCCAGSCSDPNTDQANCGTCGHQCGITCSEGACTTAQAISGRNYQTCALVSDGTVTCWGPGYGPQGGSGALLPVSIAGLSDVTQISVGGDANNSDALTCALEGDGTVTCWGDNIAGQLGDGTTTSQTSPTTSVSNLTNVLSVYAGDDSACAVLKDGTVWCWGTNEYGQLGTAATLETCPSPTVTGKTAPCSTTPVQVPGITSAKAVTLGQDHGCALLSGGTVECWGQNYTGQLGNGTTTPATTPVAVSGLSGVTAISAMVWNTCAVTTQGKVWCWGDDGRGQLGTATTTTTCVGTGGRLCALSPVDVGLNSAAAVSTGGIFECMLSTNGVVECWGENDAGQCGNGSFSTTASATAVSIPIATGVAANKASACAIVSGGKSMECWGISDSLGTGATSNSATPVVVK